MTQPATTGAEMSGDSKPAACELSRGTTLGRSTHVAVESLGKTREGKKKKREEQKRRKGRIFL